MTILGISVGTTRTGVCVLKNGILLDRHIHNYQATWSDNKLRIVTERYKRYILKRNVTAIIVKIPPLKKHTKAITKIIKRVEALAKEYSCEFDLVTKTEIKHITAMRSTNELIEYARRLYPELIAMYEKGKANDHSYYQKLYEAILAAHIYQERQRVRAEQLAHTT
jgi:RNase H-fold protein (predicted Holliday junction resolvase)